MKSEYDLRLAFPKKRMRCPTCKEEDLKTLHLMIAPETFAPLEVKVVELKNEYLTDQRLYRIKARIQWKCPSCGIPLKAIAKVRDVPVEVIRQVSSVCPICGHSLKLKDEKIVLISSGKFTDTLTISGYLVCINCTQKKPITKRLKTSFRPMWKFLSQISKVKISREGVEFERKTKASARI